MGFRRIDLDTWPRREYFQHYFNDVPCTYSLCADVDITGLLTGLRREGLKLYPAMIYGISSAVNELESFRMGIEPDGQVVCYDAMNPCYTVFHQGEESFSTVWTEYKEDFQSFYKQCLQDTAEYGAVAGIEGRPGAGCNSFDISCLPWVSFTAFNLNLKQDYNHLQPIFTLGKYRENGRKIMLPLAVQVHHGVCDGFHVSRFLQRLQQWVHVFGEKEA